MRVQSKKDLLDVVCDAEVEILQGNLDQKAPFHQKQQTLGNSRSHDHLAGENFIQALTKMQIHQL